MSGDFLERARTKPAARLLTEWLPKLDLHGGVALDLGCGSGSEAEFLAKNGFMVDAIDKSEMAIKFTRERCQGLTVDALLGDFLEFEYRPDYYSVVVAINSLPFVPPDRAPALIADIQRSLKPGGAAILAVYGPDHAWKDRADMSFWQPEEFRAVWNAFDIPHFQEYRGAWPLLTGEEIYQHRIHLVAKKK